MSDANVENGATPQEQESGGLKYFYPEMTIGEAMAVHPRVREVFAAFHLSGCAHCSISQIETLEQVCMGYGVELELLLEVLESVVSRSETAESGSAS